VILNEKILIKNHIYFTIALLYNISEIKNVTKIIIILHNHYRVLIIIINFIIIIIMKYLQISTQFIIYLFKNNPQGINQFNKILDKSYLRR